jgi:hypothetical protein
MVLQKPMCDGAFKNKVITLKNRRRAKKIDNYNSRLVHEEFVNNSK